VGRRAAAYGGLYLALAALHAPLLRLPYYWDEAGYFIYAGLDFFRHGWLVPRTTLANGHPPLLSVYLALAWWLGGFHPVVTRLAMLAWATALVGGVYRVAEGRAGRRAAAIAAGLTALTPLVFAQATLAQLDLPAAALILWALVWRGRGRRWAAAGLLAAACLMKETALIVPAVLALWDGARGRRELLAPPLALAGWYVAFHHATGYWIGNPQYVAYNVGEAAFSLPRIGLALARRVWQLGFYDGTGPLTVLAVAAAWRARRKAAAGGPEPAARHFSWFWPLIGAYVLAHAVVGGAVLARYLLPALALYYVWIGEQVARLRGARWWTLAAAAWLVAAWFWNPPYPFPFEDNLAYATFVRLHQAAARQLEAHAPGGRVWTAWPATDELTRPALGYVARPLAVGRLEDFSAASLRRLPPGPHALYLFSREYAPRVDASALPVWRRWAEEYFGERAAAPAAAWLGRARARAWFRRRRGGQWVLLAAPRAAPVTRSAGRPPD
jgi:hypothetical protein